MNSAPLVVSIAAFVTLSYPSSRSWAEPAPTEKDPGSIESAFDKAWESVISEARKTAKAGDWFVERTSDGVIVAWRDLKTASQELAQKADDAVILTTIKGRLAADPSTSARKIHVEVKKGVVTLRGDAAGPTEAKTAIRLATQTSGVSRVVSQVSWPGMTHPPAPTKR